MLLKWSDDLVTGLSSHLDPAGPEFQTVMNAFAAIYRIHHGHHRQASRRAHRRPVLHPGERGSRGTADGDDEIVMETLLILIGGDETTRHTLSGGTEQLVRHRDQWDALRADSDALLPGAIEEMLRWTSPVKNMCRTLTADTEFHGTELKRGREDHAAVRVGELRRVDVRERRSVRHPARPEQPRRFRLRHALLSGESVGPVGIAPDDRASAGTSARSAVGRRWRRIAVAPGQFRQRSGVDADGIHAERAGRG